MTRRVLPFLMVLLVVAIAHADGPPFPLSPDEYMPVSQIKAGMTGIGKTVYKGTEPSTFNFEVVGVLPNAQYGTPLIIVRVSGGPMTERKANVAGGMSGSPLYINGKLIGACSRLLVMFGIEPLCGVTPIENMADALDPKLPQEPSDFAYGPREFDEPVVIDGKVYHRTVIGTGPRPADLPADTLYMSQQPIPLLVSGLGPKACAVLQQSLPGMAVTPSGQSAGGSDGLAAIDKNALAALKPGSALGISYTVGDVELGSMGTLTYIKNNQILAFGHPSLGIGPMPGVLRTGYVLDYLPGLMRSEKLMTPHKTVGMALQDRPWAVSGVIGKLPELIPIRVRVTDVTRGRTIDLKVQSVFHPILGGTLVNAVLSEAMDRARPTPQDTTAKVRFHITADESIDITRENTFFSPIGPSGAISEISDVIGTLTSNPFHPVRPTSIEVDVELSSERFDVEVERIVVDKAQVEPGDEITVTAYLKPHRKEAFTKTLKLTVPKDTPRGKADLIVGGADGGGMNDLMRMLGLSAGIGDSSAENITELLSELDRKPKNTDLVATLQLKSLTPKARGQKLEGLPKPLVSAMNNRRATGGEYERQQVEVRIPTEYVITGSQRLSLTVNAPRNGGPQPDSQEMPEDMEMGAGPVIGDTQFVSTQVGKPISSVGRLAARAATAFQESEDEDLAEVENVEETPSGDNTEKPKEGPAEKPISRQVTVWTENTADAFRKGELKGIGASSKNDLRPMPTLKSVAQFDDPYVFCAVPDGYGNTFVGTGNQGHIYRITDGKAEILYTSPEIAVLSAAIDRDGNIIAGTAPNGKVYSVSKDGRGRLLFDAAEPNITAICVASDGVIYAGVSEPAKVYRIGADGTASVAFAPKAMCVTTLAPGANGTVLVGLGQPGCVYRIDGTNVLPVYDCGGGYITAVAEANGAVYAAGDPAPKIEKIKGSSITPVVKKTDGTVRGMAVDARGNVYAATADSFLRIDPEDVVVQIDSPEDADLSCLATAPNGDVSAGTFVPAQVLTGNLSATMNGTFESAVREVGPGARWSKISWLDNGAPSDSVKVYARSGDVFEPDATWSGWSGPYAKGQTATCPEARYVQYKIEMTGNLCDVPIVKQIDLSYLPKNQRPTISMATPKAGEHISGEYKIEWKATDPDKDKLEYLAYSSSDQGKTWTKLAEKVAEEKKPAAKDGDKPEPDKPAAEVVPPPDTKPQVPVLTQEDIDAAMAELESQLREAGIPEADIQAAVAEANSLIEAETAKLAAQGGAPAQAEASATDKKAEPGLQETSLTWKTADVADGEYIVKVVASDRIANGADVEEETALVASVLVCNKKPTIALPTSGIVVGKDGVATVSGSVLQAMINVTSVEWRVDDGQWRSATAEDWVFDSDTENYTFTTDPMAKGKHKIEVRAFNSAGLMSAESREVNVE